MKRSCGTLMHISSLPSPYGVGTLGKAAFAFADFLVASGQSYWQMLPLGPTGYGDSPYQCASTFAGNPYFIDLDLLIEDGLLLPEEVETVDWGDDETHVDFGRIFCARHEVLRRAFARGFERDAAAVAAFREAQAGWVEGYALFPPSRSILACGRLTSGMTISACIRMRRSPVTGNCCTTRSITMCIFSTCSTGSGTLCAPTSPKIRFG